MSNKKELTYEDLVLIQKDGERDRAYYVCSKEDWKDRFMKEFLKFQSPDHEWKAMRLDSQIFFRQCIGRDDLAEFLSEAYYNTNPNFTSKNLIDPLQPVLPEIKELLERFIIKPPLTVTIEIPGKFLLDLHEAFSWTFQRAVGRVDNSSPEALYDKEKLQMLHKAFENCKIEPMNEDE